jgi:hypothetical protein
MKECNITNDFYYSSPCSHYDNDLKIRNVVIFSRCYAYMVA